MYITNKNLYTYIDLHEKYVYLYAKHISTKSQTLRNFLITMWIKLQLISSNDFSQFNYPITPAHINFMMRSHLRGRKYKVYEIKVPICVVYTLGRRKFKKRKKKE